MAINLNKKNVTKENILIYIQDIDVYRYYTGKEVSLKGVMKSPLRNENNPSFGYFIGENNEICFNDYNLGGGDFIKFVQLKFGLNYFEAMNKIVNDFNLIPHFFFKNSKKVSKDYNPEEFDSREKILAKANNFELGKKRRDWTASDLSYWYQYGIDKETLIRYNVEPISYIFINKKPILADKYSYCFIERKDGKETYKIYQPFNKKYKWLNNHNFSVWQGWEQLPEKDEVLIITKSLKDVMSIVNVAGFPSVSLQAENVKPKRSVIRELHKRFEYIYLLYDNDYDKEVNWGQKFAEELSSNFRLFNIKIYDKYESKDFSDLVKNKGTNKSKEILEKIILEYVPF